MNGTGHVPEPSTESPTGLNILTAEALFAPLSPVPWLCQSLRVAPGAPTLFAGYGYSGKSVALQALAVAVASGSLLWGQYVCRRGKVLHLDYEQGRRITSERYQRLAYGLGIGLDDVAGRLEAGILPSVSMTADLAARIGEGRALCLLDSWRAAHADVDENSSEVRRTLDAMGVASEKTGCTFITLLHSRKPQKDAPGGGKMAIRGSSGFFDGAQTVVLFDGTTVGRPIVTVEKERLGGEAIPPFALRIEDVDGRAGLRVTLETLEEPAAPPTGAEKLAETMALLRRLVPERPGLGGEALAEILGRRRQSVVAALQTLVAAGELRIDGTGPKRGFYPVTEVPFDV